MTRICPLSPKLIPEFCKNLVSGLTPIDNITISVVTDFPLSSLMIISFPSSWNSTTFSEIIRLIPLFTSSYSKIFEISLSNGAKIWGAASIKVVSIPKCFKFSAVSIPT